MFGQFWTCLDLNWRHFKTSSLSFDQEPMREGRPFMLAERSFLQKQAADIDGSPEMNSMSRTCKDLRGIQAMEMTSDWGLPLVCEDDWNEITRKSTCSLTLQTYSTFTPCPVSNLSLTNLVICWFCEQIVNRFVPDIGYSLSATHRPSPQRRHRMHSDPQQRWIWALLKLTKKCKDLVVLSCAAMWPNFHLLLHLAAISSAFVDRDRWGTIQHYAQSISLANAKASFVADHDLLWFTYIYINLYSTVSST